MTTATITVSDLQEGMESISLHYRLPFSARHTVVWFNTLGDLTPEQWWRAIDQLLKQEPTYYLPLPKDIRALAGVSQKYLPPTREWEPPSEEEQAKTKAMIANFKKQQGWT